METIQKDPLTKDQKQWLLEYTINHYTTENRAASARSGCSYAMCDGRKCAIGLHLTQASLQVIGSAWIGDEMRVIASDGGDPLKIIIDNEIVEMHLDDADFYSDIQHLHDTRGCWNDKGISEYGKVYVNATVKDFKLRDPFAKKKCLQQ